MDFLRRAGNDYGYASSPGGHIDEWRSRELPQLISPLKAGAILPRRRRTTEQQPDEPEVYLDYAGSALPVKSQLLSSNNNPMMTMLLLANPHSTGPAAARTQRLLQQVRQTILQHLDALPGRLAGLKNNNNNNSINANETDNHPGYDLIFTSGTSEALRIVAERFPWSPSSSCCCCGQQQQQQQQQQQSILVYPQSVHTSVIGMRECILQRGGRFVCKPLEDLRNDVLQHSSYHHRRNTKGDDGQEDDSWCSGSSSSAASANCTTCGASRNLLVLPLECNFGGDRLVMRGVNYVRDFQKGLVMAANGNKKWSILLDIAKAASTGPVSLRTLNPDFACLSFYKLFGEPTGLGCLLVKRTAVPLLTTTSTSRKHPQGKNHEDHRLYFGGGTVDAVLATEDFVVRRSSDGTGVGSLESLVSGTPHFRGIVSLQAGFAELKRVGGMQLIRVHSVTLMRELVRRLNGLRHYETDLPVVLLYGAWAKYDLEALDASVIDELPGPTTAFNILRQDGTYVGYNEFSKLAALNRPPLQLRTGCFCNPGGCQLALQLSNEDVVSNFQSSGHVCGDQIDLIQGKPTGAIRVSFGKDSTWEDLDALIHFIERMYVRDTSVKSITSCDRSPRNVLLSEIYLYPIKSAAAQRVRKWQMDASTGKLLYDREFALVDSSGTAMRLQLYPKMAFIRPRVDLERRTMTISAPGRSPIELGLDESCNHSNAEGAVNVCGNRCGAVLWGDIEVSEWFSEFLGVQCWLARHSGGGQYVPANSPTQMIRSPSVAFANEQPLLLISEHAVDCINDVLTSQNQKPVTSKHFRPNLVVRLAGRVALSTSSHAEDGWKYVELTGKDTKLEVVGQCARCSMVDVDPSSGMKGETLRALADYRRNNGQITFGIFLRGTSSEQSEKELRTVLVEEGDILRRIL